MALFKRKTPLKVGHSLKARTPLKTRTRLKSKQKTARKLKSPYHSIFTEDMHVCYISGDTWNVEPHHIFQGKAYKALSEKYGFMIPLRSDWHRTAKYSIHQDRNLSIDYKIRCQEYYINCLGKTREEWLEEFGRWWTEENYGAGKKENGDNG